MKVLPQEDKDRIQESRMATRRSRLLDDIARTDRKIKYVDRILFCTFCLTLVLISSALIWLLVSRKGEERRRYREETYASFQSLIEQAEGIDAQRKEAIEKLDLDLVHNYPLIAKTRDVTFIFDEINKARAVVSVAHEEIQQLFKDIYARFPAESINERKDAQRLYGDIMGRLDAEDGRLEDLEAALSLLSENRSKWVAKHGKPVFSSLELEREFKYYVQDTDPSTARWRKDFGSSVIESPPVAIPTGK